MRLDETADGVDPTPAMATATTQEPPLDPALEYRRRKERAEAEVSRCEAQAERTANARLLVGIAALVVLIIALRTGAAAWWGWLALPAAVFIGLVVVSTRLANRLERARAAVLFHDQGLDRVEGRWPGRGESGQRFLDPEHPYAGDLDVFGPGSIYERLCTARTGAGQATLAAWLTAPAALDEVRQRQQAVVELSPRLALREDLARLAAGLREGIDPAALVAWAERPSGLPGSRLVHPLLNVLSLAALTATGALLMGRTGLGPLALVLIVEMAVGSLFARRVEAELDGLESHARHLDILAFLLERIETEPFHAPRLLQVRHQLLGHAHDPRPDSNSNGGGPGHGPIPADALPSRQIARLARLLDRLEYRHNTLFAPIAAMLFWGTRHAYRVDAWRQRSGRAIAGWLEAIGDFEALAALATYAFENPRDPFPTFDDDHGPRFDARQLGHPLIDPAVCVRNDLRLDRDLSLLLVTGSNMSGKSTLLRSVGVAAVLAQTGAPVRAESLVMSSLMPGGTIRVQDSLQAGRSRFYAEILRLRILVDLASRQPPLLFLIDEILHGTNSHDRREGGAAIVRGLIDRGAIGLVSTHDLSLAQIAESLAPRAANIHFADELKNGQLAFDYTIRPGVVTRSNALELMRAVGLDV